MMKVLRFGCLRLSDSSAPQGIVSAASRTVVYILEALSVKVRPSEVSIPQEISTKLSVLLHAMLEMMCTRLQSSVIIGERLVALKDGTANEELKQMVTLEQSRTIPVLGYLAAENYEHFLAEERLFLRGIPTIVKFGLQIIRTLNGRVPDADVMGRLFKNLCLAIPILRGDPQSETHIYKQTMEMFVEMEPHVFQEVWTKYMLMYFDCLIAHPSLMSIVQLLYNNPATTASLTGLVLRHLVDNLESLLETNGQTVAVAIRLLRLTFMSVANLPEGIDRLLAPHLPRLLVDIFPMAARSQDARNFLCVPHYLFRALGSKGQTNKFDAIHKEIYPFLAELLDGVNRALELTEDPVQREQLVEIALTTPARLQYLVPYLTLLWRPLVLALNSKTPDVVKQGLRTLELASENLPLPDLLDPSAEPVAKELVLALHRALKPGSANAETAQMASRILGRLGGRNRRILSFPPTLSYEQTTRPVTLPVEFTSHMTSLHLGPTCDVAITILKDVKASSYHDAAFNFIRIQIFSLLHKGIDDQSSEEFFVRCIEGAIYAIHLSNLEPAASELLREIAKSLSEMELAKEANTQSQRRFMVNSITTLFFETIVTVLVHRPSDSMQIDEPLSEEARNEMSVDEQQHYDWMHKPVSQKVDSYLTVFALDLKSPTKLVRETTQARFELLAELAGLKLADFMKPAVEKIASNIFGKPLRMFLPPTQIGYMEAMTYLLRIEPSLLSISEELLRLISEAVGLGELDEAHPPVHPMHKISRRVMVLSAQTKAAAIRLITASLIVVEFFNKHQNLRQRATALLFKALYSSDKEVKLAAHDGLKFLLTHQSRLPREHLQAGLRPVLMNLADASKLTTDSLEGLARLLGLLTNYFKVEIASKLIDHFAALANDENLRSAAYGPMADNDIIRKLVRLLNIFHLLPRAAIVYLDPVMQQVVQAETKIHAVSPTPFTPPMSAFLDGFPEEAVKILFSHIKDSRWVQSFRHVIQEGTATRFIQELKDKGSHLAERLEEAEHGHAGVPSILLCLDLAKSDPNWMAGKSDILDALKVVWASQFTTGMDDSAFASARLVLIRAIYTIWMEVFKVSPRVDILVTLSLIFTQPLEMSYADVLDFIAVHVSNKTSAEFKHQAVQHLFVLLDDQGTPESHLLQYLRVIVIPLMTAEFRQTVIPDDVVSDGFMTKISGKVWKVPTSQWPHDVLIELLQVTSILILHGLPKPGTDTRPLVARYIWDLLREARPMVRSTISLTAARFFSVEGLVADKFQRPLWQGLLKAPQDGEASPISRQALDIMTPVMTRLPVNDSTLKWDYQICRTLGEEQHNIVTVVHIYRLILRHSDLCYQSRELFIPQIASGLNKLGFNAGNTPETRALALDLIELIISWQRKASEEQVNAMVVDSSGGTSSWTIPLQVKESIVTYLVRFSLSSNETYSKPGLNSRHLVQLKTLCGLPDWSAVNIRTTAFARAFEMPEGNDRSPTPQLNSLVNNAKVLNIIQSEKPLSWVLDNANDLFNFSKRAMVEADDRLVDAFSPIFDRLLEALSLGEEGVELTGISADVVQWLHDTVRDAISSGTKLGGILSILMALAKWAPSRMESAAGGLMKIYTKLVRELTTTPPIPPDQLSAVMQRVFTILDISRLCVQYFGEHRKQFLSGLVLLVTGAQNQDLRRHLLSMTREWIFGPPVSVPTTKEKASLMQKMQAWSKFGDAVYKDYLALVYEIYDTPSMARTDLTVRLEASFLLGCKAEDMSTRTRFLNLFSEHIPKQIGPRLAYLLGGQSWDILHDFNWAFIVLDMIFGAINGYAPLMDSKPALATLSIPELRVSDVLQSVRHLLYFDTQAMHGTFVALFPEIWGGLSRKEQGDITASMIHILTKEFHADLPQINIFQTLLASVHRCNPPMALPPHVVKWLAKSYQCWYEGLEFLQVAVEIGREDDAAIREANQDALAEVYAELCEDDYYYGLWRRRCLYEETNAALSYEQNGFYHFAQPLYEAAQLKARQSIYPMSEAEYYVWEDHWMLCSEKLMQWDILQDVASGEGNADLALECGWRTLQTWNQENATVTTYLNSVQTPLTPRRVLFKAYHHLYSMACTLREQQQTAAQLVSQGLQPPPPVRLAVDSQSEFTKFVDEANQLTLRKWDALPEGLTMAHVPLLAQFQQVVELREAAVLMGNLAATTRENLNEKAQEAKAIFQHWRDRLPLTEDDIGLWNDLVSWRQHVFHAVNKFYLPLSPEGPSQPATATHIHRGHHESAWIINRFAHVARKHGLLQVCQKFLDDIYRLPNIEISEAFLKLREQARCNYEKQNEWYGGLEVINNTNLMYFSGAQKSEFFAIKGMFLHRLNRHEDANQALGQAVQLDHTVPKSWALWGIYSDDMHHLNPMDFMLAANAVSCYLQAASLYRSSKSRPYLNRTLWLLSMDDQEETVGRAFQEYKGEHVYWYWITFIPQLLMSLSQKEGKYAHFLLLGIAKGYPQAVFFPLRAQREEFLLLKKGHMTGVSESVKTESLQPATNSATSTAPQGGGTDGSVPLIQPPHMMDTNAFSTLGGQKQPWDMADELVTLLKTGHPLLALSMEQLAEQIRERLKPNQEEEVYRMTCQLLTDAIGLCSTPSKEVHTVGAAALYHAQKLLHNVPPGPIRDQFEAQINNKPTTMLEYIQSVIKLRDQYEAILDRRPRVQSTEVWSHYLVEFHLNRSEKIAVPGQFLEHKDASSPFVDIKRISTKLERCRSPLLAFRRITFIGHDASVHTFTVQTYPQRGPRRDERLAQLTRIYNEVLQHKREARKRNLEFHVLQTVSLNPFIRLIKIDNSYISLMDIYDDHCSRNGFGREEPTLLFQEKLRVFYNARTDDGKGRDTDILKSEYLQVRLDAKNEVEAKYIPRTVLADYMKRIMTDSTSLWLMRKQFTRQIAALNFLTFCMFLNVPPKRVLVSRETGLVGLIDTSFNLRVDSPTPDHTPFRLTPNLQEFITPIGIEGLMTSTMLALSRGLLEPEPLVEKQLWLFIRDDFMMWYKSQGKNPLADMRLGFRKQLAETISAYLKRMSQLSGSAERARAGSAEGVGSLPSVTVVTGIQQAINLATNPQHQAKMPDQTYPWF
ncbi:hypothetical protein FS842_006757 [Serendipita sp. 407]|nr:hypothetical protein FS842_006757 [Serendipita sp. 407]